MIQRGNNRTPCFDSHSDYLVYLDILQDCAQFCGCAVHAYVLMTNHVHLLLTPDDIEGPSMMMQRVGRRYVRYFNDRHHRTGTLWEGRFHSCLVADSAYFLTCHRYIELNPVRARITRTPEEYFWSSYRANGLGHEDTLITPHPIYICMGDDERTRQSGYRALFNEALSEEEIEQIRQASHGNRALGQVNLENPKTSNVTFDVQALRGD
jgi:putative transposase